MQSHKFDDKMVAEYFSVFTPTLPGLGVKIPESTPSQFLDLVFQILIIESVCVCVCVCCSLMVTWSVSQNNNLERALDWIFTHPEEEQSDALSDMADTEPTNHAFSMPNSHSDPTLSPDPEADAAGPRIKDGPGREWLQISLRFLLVNQVKE